MSLRQHSGACDGTFAPDMTSLAQLLGSSCCLPMQSLGLGSKDEGEAEQAAKRARNFMEDFAALPLDSLSPEQAVAQSQTLYQQLAADAASMPTLRRLLQV